MKITKVAIQINQKNKKVIKVDGKTSKKRKELFGKNNVVILSPEDQIITKGGPRERRVFFDRLFSIINKEYLSTLQNYNRALKQRNALLNNKESLGEEIYLPWEEKLSIHAVKLWEFRKKYFSDYTTSLNSVVGEYQKN